MRLIFLSFIFLLMYPSKINVYAAACCASGGSFPNLRLGDERWSYGVSFNQSYVVGEINSSGTLISRDSMTQEQKFSLTNRLNMRFGDRFQLGFRVPLLRKGFEDQSHWGVGDIQGSIGFEPFPLYTYSSWRPRLFLVPSLQMPTAKSSYEVEGLIQTESQGTGFWTPSFAVLIWKSIQAWDFYSNFELRFPFARSFDRMRVNPGLVYSGILGLGYSFSALRFGSSLGATLEEEKSFQGGGRQPQKQVWDTQIEVSYNLSDVMTVSSNYSDQTLIGPAKNVSPERSFGLSFVYLGL